MAAGAPVVASDIPGYDETLRDGVDGLLVPAGDPIALALTPGSIWVADQRENRLGRFPEEQDGKGRR